MDDERSLMGLMSVGDLVAVNPYRPPWLFVGTTVAMTGDTAAGEPLRPYTLHWFIEGPGVLTGHLFIRGTVIGRFADAVG